MKKGPQFPLDLPALSEFLGTGVGDRLPGVLKDHQGSRDTSRLEHPGESVDLTYQESLGPLEDKR